MHDFWTVGTKAGKKDALTVYPKFIVNPRTKDLMIRGGDFYAVWDDASGLWSKDESTVIDIVDKELRKSVSKLEKSGKDVTALYMHDSDSGSIDRWHKYCQKQMRDRFVNLDEKIVFANTKVTKRDYVSKRLSYSIEEGSLDAYEELISTLYEPKEREKIEWAIGAIISGDAKHIQKFEVLYGSHGTGKSTILHLIEALFDGYWNTFNAKELGMANSAFALESCKNNPLVSIQHDGDLSRIEDNTKLNSIVSHESMEVNAKYTKLYTSSFKSFLFMGTNKPVKITEAKSGIIRRLIDVHPSGRKIPYKKFKELESQTRFELGAIAQHCLDIYLSLGESYYESYVPTEMISATNDFYDFIEYNYDDFVKKNMITQTEAWNLYKEYCEFAHAYQMPLQKMKQELRNYFKEFDDRKTIDGKRYRNLYFGFLADKFKSKVEKEEETSWLKMDKTESLFDKALSSCPAQYAKEDGSPKEYWAKVKSSLKDIDTSKLHWVKPSGDWANLVAIDFDIRGKDGKKDADANLKAASKWPKTYAEFSKSGAGIHLCYIYEGDVSKLSHVFDEYIEVKTFEGGSSLRRMLSKCNDIPIGTLKEGSLKLKGDDKKTDWDGIKSEKQLRTMIIRNLNKEYHQDTSSSIDYINHLLTQAYESGVTYDVSDLQTRVLIFAMSSTNQSDRCVKVVGGMHFKSEDKTGEGIYISYDQEVENIDAYRMVFYDCEVYSNFFGLVWKYAGSPTAVRMVNPTPEDVAEFIKLRKIIGFNCRQYDNHIVYARAFRNYSNEQLYELSQEIISKHSGFIGNAYDISYTDVYDFSTEKKSLKKWEIALGIHHQEMGIPWDQPVPDDMIEKVMDYCENDVRATEAVFNARAGDFMARKIQVALVNLLHGDDIKVTVNDTTNTLSKRIIFGKNKNPQSEFNYRDMSKPVGSDEYEKYLEKFGADYCFRVFNDIGLPEYRDYIPGEVLPKGWSILPFFPEYKFGFSDRSAFYNEEITKEVGLGKSIYLGEAVGEGGRVYSVPGYYQWVWDGDVSSQHPHSIIAEVLFGPRYTKIFEEIVKARVAVKHKDFKTAGKLLGGALQPYLKDEYASDLAQALKIVINSIYGLTKAGFVNEFRDKRNEDNIVAKRGALLMTLLKREVERLGYKVCHIKTDSIKIPNADDFIKEFVVKFGREYGYEFETEGVFTKFCLLNDAAYIAKCEDGRWITKATQFNKDSNPYVYKKLFSHEKIDFSDMCETKSVSKGALYLDMNEELDDVTEYEKLLEKKLKKGESGEDIDNLKSLIASGHDYRFVGRVGLFTPIRSGFMGGVLYRYDNGKYYAAPGTTGYRWLESEHVKKYGMENMIDRSYYDKLVDQAIDDIREIVGKEGVELDFFLSDDIPEKNLGPSFMNIPESVGDEIPWD